MIVNRSIPELPSYGSAACYCDYPTAAQIAAGVVPLDSLPAEWWNAIWACNNGTFNCARTVVNNLADEICNAIVCSGIALNANCNSQLYQAIKQYGTANQAGAVKSSSTAGQVAIDNNGIMSLNCYGSAALQTTAQNLTGAINELKCAIDNFQGVTYSDATPLVDGTASAGTCETAARGDHRHPIGCCICTCTDNANWASISSGITTDGSSCNMIQAQANCSCNMMCVSGSFARNCMRNSGDCGINMMYACGCYGRNSMYAEGACGYNSMTALGRYGCNNITVTGINGCNNITACGCCGYNQLIAMGCWGYNTVWASGHYGHNLLYTDGLCGYNSLYTCGCHGYNSLYTTGACGSNSLYTSGTYGHNCITADGLCGYNRICAAGCCGYNQICAAGDRGKNLLCTTGIYGYNQLRAYGCCSYNQLCAEGDKGHNQLYACGCCGYNQLYACGDYGYNEICATRNNNITSACGCNNITSECGYNYVCAVCNYICGTTLSALRTGSFDPDNHYASVTVAQLPALTYAKICACSSKTPITTEVAPNIGLRAGSSCVGCLFNPGIDIASFGGTYCDTDQGGLSRLQLYSAYCVLGLSSTDYTNEPDRLRGVLQYTGNYACIAVGRPYSTAVVHPSLVMDINLDRNRSSTVGTVSTLAYAQITGGNVSANLCMACVDTKWCCIGGSSQSNCYELYVWRGGHDAALLCQGRGYNDECQFIFTPLGLFHYKEAWCPTGIYCCAGSTPTAPDLYGILVYK